MRKKITGLVLLTIGILVIIGGTLFIHKANQERILLPPTLSCELLLEEEPFSCDLLVKKANAGVYQYVCQYTLDETGEISLADKNHWQSYEDTIGNDIYTQLKNLSEKSLTQVLKTDTGFLLIFHGTLEEPITIIETDLAGTILFSYDFMANNYSTPCETVFADAECLYILSYRQNTDELCITTVNKETGEETTTSFSYNDLSGEMKEETRMGGFIFEGANLWIQNNVLYFAETCYSQEPGTVIAAYDLIADKPLYYQKIENAQVMAVRWQSDIDRFFVLLNEKNYTPLRLLEFVLSSGEEISQTELALPEEFIAEDAQPGDYYLFTVDMTENYVAVVMDDQSENTDDTRKNILVVYQSQSGDMVYRSRLTLDANYEIYSVAI